MPNKVTRKMELSLILNDKENDLGLSSPTDLYPIRAPLPDSEHAIRSLHHESLLHPNPSSYTQARDPRFRYSDEESYFLWYHRTDLGQSSCLYHDTLTNASQVERRCRARWPNLMRKKGGLTCKFYRILNAWGVETVREQNRCLQRRGGGDKVARYGVVARTNVRFPWMRPEHYRHHHVAHHQCDVLGSSMGADKTRRQARLHPWDTYSQGGIPTWVGQPWSENRTFGWKSRPG